MNKRAINPLLPPDWCVPDCEARVVDRKLYLYGSWDTTRERYCSKEYHVVHTADFIEWEKEDISFESDQAAWAEGSKVHSSVSNVTSFDELPEHIKKYLPEEARQIPIEQIVAAIEAQAQKNLSEETLLYAPDAITVNNKTYLYMCLSDDTEGVAVSPFPNGPFDGAKQLKTNRTATPIVGIDPSVFIDTDGSAYYYWGQFEAKAAKLTEDMMEIQEETIVDGIITEEKHHFHEGSSVRKRGDIYYYVFADSSRGKPTCLGYCTGKSPLGPFTYQGVIVDNAKCDPKSWNNHGSIEEYNGQWYVFYHKSYGNSEYMRRVCAEPIHFNEQGLIQEVKPTSQGVGEPFGLNESIPAFSACEVEGTAYVAKIGEQHGLYVETGTGSAVYRYVKNNSPAKVLNISAKGKGDLEVYADGKLIGTGAIELQEIHVVLDEGVHEIQLKIKSEEATELYSLCFK